MSEFLVTEVACAAAIKFTHGRYMRIGQCAFNALHEIRPDLAYEIRGTRIDPFFHDANVPAFYEWLEQQQ